MFFETLSFSKSGTTWVQNVVWQLKNNVDFSGKHKYANYNFLELAALEEMPNDGGHILCDKNEYKTL